MSRSLKLPSMVWAGRSLLLSRRSGAVLREALIYERNDLVESGELNSLLPRDALNQTVNPLDLLRTAKQRAGRGRRIDESFGRFGVFFKRNKVCIIRT